MLSPADAIDRVPGWSHSNTRIVDRFEGLNNLAFKVLHDEALYILRLPASAGDGGLNERPREIRIHARAAEAGIAPAVVFSDERVLVTRFVESQPATRETFESQRFVESLGRLLRTVHALPLDGQRFDPVGWARHYRASIAVEPALLPVADRCVRLIAGIVESFDAAANAGLACCHNDVVGANLLVGDSITLIDWEFAADNDPYFDLASPLVYHELGPDVAENLLSSYWGGAQPEQRERLASSSRLFEALFWLWLARRQLLYPGENLQPRFDRLGARLKHY